MSGCAWVTLATNDTYCLGALVLAHSLKRVSTSHQLAIIITPHVSPSMREQLSKVFNVIHLVDVLDSQDATNLALLQRPELGVTFTKIHCWTLTQFSKCVFLDADTLVMQNCDELMEREELSAAPDPGWPDCFNSGVFVFVPSLDTFSQLIQFASTHGSFDGGDQGLLNMYFNDWPTNDIRKHLSFLYNMCSTSTYTYLPALNYYGANIKIVHFIGPNKPWLLGPSGVGMSTFTQAWWDTFQSHVVQLLTKDMTGLAGALGSKEKSAIEEQWRKQNWEQGNIDFTGKDSFENIWMKIMEAVNKPKADISKPSPQKVGDIPLSSALKELASQAIPEKEKADIPVESPKEGVKSAESPASDIVKSVVPFTPPPIPCEIPKEGGVPMVPAPSQPIPMPPPTPEAVTPSLEPIKPPGVQTSPPIIPPGSVVDATTAVPPSITSSQTKPTESAPKDQTAPSQTPLTQDPATDIRLKLERALEMDDMKKVEEILSEIEEEVIHQLEEPVATKPDLPKEPLKPTEEGKKTEESPILQPSAPVSEVVAPAVESKILEAPLPQPPKPDTPLPDATKVETLPSEPPKDKSPMPGTPASETPKSDAPKTGAEIPLSSQAPSEPPKSLEPQADLPKSAEVLSQQPKPSEPQLVQSTPSDLQPDQAKPIETQSDQPKPAEPQITPELPKPSETQPDLPKPAESQGKLPESSEPQQEQPKSSEVQPKPTEIKPDLPTSTEAKPDQSAPTQTKPDQPKPLDAQPEVPKTETPPPASEIKDAVAPPLNISSQGEAKPGIQKDAPESTLPVSETVQSQPQDSAAKPQPTTGAKQKTPPKDQSKEGHKPGKQQAPQPPPKNGKQKKGQQPEPTTAHPLAETPVQEQQKPVPVTPLPLLESTDKSVPEIQPGTPTVIAPTPPVTPVDAPKTADPLSAPVEEPPVGATTSGPAEAPVPPKRKGKGNDSAKQPQKQQNNGGKGKGKK